MHSRHQLTFFFFFKCYGNFHIIGVFTIFLGGKWVFHLFGIYNPKTPLKLFFLHIIKSDTPYTPSCAKNSRKISSYYIINTKIEFIWNMDSRFKNYTNLCNPSLVFQVIVNCFRWVPIENPIFKLIHEIVSKLFWKIK